MAVVYRHIRKDKNEPFYIGIGADEKRAFSLKSRNDYWKKIVMKTEYEIEILFDDLTWEEACEKEKEFIALYGRKDLGNGSLVNMTDGGEGFLSLSYDAKKRQRENTIKVWTGKKHSEESIEKIRQASNRQWALSKNTGMKGKKHTEETKRYIGSLNYGSKKNIKIILDLETGVFYDCIKDLSKSIDIKYKKFHKDLLLGKYKNKYVVL